MSPGAARRRAPDPLRAHGAWVYLAASTLAGVLAAAGRGALAALFAGVGFVGVFLAAGALAVGARRAPRRLAGGVALAVGATALGLALGADPTYLAYAGVAVFPAGAAVWFAVRQGYRSGPALAFAVTALAVAAPAAACAGGNEAWLNVLLLALLAPFFAWRAWRTRARLAEGGFTRARLRRLGLVEAGIALGWTAAALLVVHALA